MCYTAFKLVLIFSIFPTDEKAILDEAHDDDDDRVVQAIDEDDIEMEQEEVAEGISMNSSNFLPLKKTRNVCLSLK